MRGHFATWGIPLLLVLACLLVYVRVYRAQFVAYDDDRHLSLNENLNPPSWRGLARHWTETYYGIYAPLAYTLFAGEAWLAAGESATGIRTFDPLVFHVTNVLLHAACVLLVYAVLRLLVADRIAAVLGALLFAWHPLQVESVAWVSETRGTLAGIFSLWSIYEYLRFRGLRIRGQADVLDSCDVEPTGEFSRGALRHYVLAALAYLLALLCKPSAVSVPLMLMLLDVIWLRRGVWRALLGVGWWCAPAVALAMLTSTAQAEAVDRFTFEVPWWQRPLIVVDSLNFYLWKLAVPYGLAIDYGRTPPYVMSSAWIYVSWLFPLALALVLAYLPQRRAWFTAAGLYVAGVAPVLGLLTFGFQEISTVSDRYVYLAMLGPAFAVAWLVAHVGAGGLRIETALVLSLLAGLTIYYTGFWHDSRTLFDRALEINPQSVVSLNGRAVVAIDEKNYEEAEQLLLRAIDLKPNDPTPLTNLGIVYQRLSRPAEAVVQFQRAIQAMPGFTQAQLYLGKQYYEQRDWSLAVEALLPLVKRSPDLAEARLYVGLSLLNSNRAAESLEHWEAILRVMPQNIDAHLAMGNALAKLGRLTEAREHFLAVLEVRPNNTSARAYLDWVETQLRPAPASTP